MRRLIAYIVLAVLLSARLKAQQDPMYTQYMFNGTLYNPAFTGEHKTLSATLQNRFQWVGMDGAPTTFVMTVHDLLNDQLSGYGGAIYRDQIGATTQTGLRGMFSHRILMKNATLSMGVQAGVLSYRTNFQQLEIRDEEDAVFEDSKARILPNFGVGMLYYSKNYYISLSVPRIVNNRLSRKYTNTESEEERHYYLGAGVVIPLNENLSIKPNFLTKMVAGAPLQFDANANLQIYDRYWVGVSYRIGESIDLLLEMKILDNLRIGYSADFITNSLSTYLGSSHEVMFNFRVAPKRKSGGVKPYDPRHH